MTAGIVSHERAGHAVVDQLPCRQPAPLVPGTGLINPYMYSDSAVMSQIYRRQSRAVIDTCQPSGIAVGQDVYGAAPLSCGLSPQSARGHFPRSRSSQPPHHTVLLQLLQGLCMRRIFHNTVVIRSTAHARLTAVGRAAFSLAASFITCYLKYSYPLAVFKKREPYSPCCRCPDQRCTPHCHAAYGHADIFTLLRVNHFKRKWQPPLINDIDRRRITLILPDTSVIPFPQPSSKKFLT